MLKKSKKIKITVKLPSKEIKEELVSLGKEKGMNQEEIGQYAICRYIKSQRTRKELGV